MLALVIPDCGAVLLLLSHNSPCEQEFLSWCWYSHKQSTVPPQRPSRTAEIKHWYSQILWLPQRYSEPHQGADSRSFSCKHLLWRSWHMGPSTALNSLQDMFNTQHITCCRRLFSSHSSFFTWAVVTSLWSVKKHFSNILHHLVNTDHYTCDQDH